MTPAIDKNIRTYSRESIGCAREVFDTLELPKTYEAITPEWLTSILCVEHPGAEVVGFQLGAPDSHASAEGSWNCRRIYLEYNEIGRAHDLPRALFCKATHNPTTRILLAFIGTSRGEAIFYKRIRPFLNIEAPRALFARFDSESFNSLIVLRDLSEDVKEFCCHATKITRARVEGQLALLAEFHGKCYSNPYLGSCLASLQTWPEFFGKMGILGIKDGANLGFLAAQDVIPHGLYRRGSEIWPAALASVERHSRLLQTLVHGDVHLKNWYVTNDDTMGLADWETASRGHWSRDVALVIATVLAVEERRAWERELLRFYIDRLNAAGALDVGFDEAWKHYQQQAMSALIWWTFMLSGEAGFPNLPPENSVMECVRRSATAVDDLESLGSL